jgi:hypothetical protein
MRLKENLLIIGLFAINITILSSCILAPTAKPLKSPLYTAQPPEVNGNGIQPPRENMSKVVFVWWRAYKPSFPNTLFDNGEVIGVTEMDSYFEYECTPGSHIFATCADLRGLAFLEGELLPNRTYYIYTNQVPGTTFLNGQIFPICPLCDRKIWEEMQKKINTLNKIVLTNEFGPWKEKFKEEQKKGFLASYHVWRQNSEKNVILPEFGI